jgi:hypothetical protein
MHQDIRDFTLAFLFKVCMRGDVRFLGVEYHAPNRRLPVTCTVPAHGP